MRWKEAAAAARPDFAGVSVPAVARPWKRLGGRAAGLDVVERVPLVVEPATEACRRYLAVKRDRMGHVLPDFVPLGV